MSPRGGGDRTPEQREAARRDRERRRLERAGEPIPDHLLEPHERAAAEPEPPAAPPPASEPEPVFFDAPAAAEPPPAAHEPFFDEPAPPPHEPEPPRAEPASPRPAAHEPLQETQQWDVTEAWNDDAPSRAPEPPVPGLEPPAPDPDATQLHETVPDVPSFPSQPADPAAPATGEHEEPLGTRRVSRAHLPNIHRPQRGGKKQRGDVPKGRGVRVKRPGEVMAGSRKRRSAGPRIVAGVAVVLVLALLWFVNGIFQPFGGGDGSGRVVVRIPEGASAGDIASLLEERGVISSSFFFGLRASISGERSNLKSGTYTLRREMGNSAAIDELTKTEEVRAVPVVQVSIPEGRSRRETVAIARRAGLRGNYLVASRRSSALNPVRYGAPRDATLEGFLFPATYELNRGARVQRLVADQLRAFRQNFATIDLGYARSKRLTAFDVLTIASMVEREVSVPSERPLVAAVIYNRLRDGIPLGIDATLRYEQNDWINPLKQSVLDADTPYNTRTKQGLPPGPIGSPGLASIRAAARPANSRALYYVVRPGTCGEHAFSDSFEEFQQDVAAYNQAREAAGGRSPTRC
ncbi:endolytic transglycosylase MltG [Conexibacter stalactiti]|uniref:Endolytic murein transglycosylase n=1 Tax=Conexibacter stalactiti TaxID=1940611 RepID=A0ABU4HN27_9ACTN|nr:endolytic transglycosylase MltG [Conexibacter stalactiti]MDW5594700.1 endolytic transglycosylase MltG [Conexibacter stalactiti]MEC5035342.1 endolytic transglycosylase MltG [Conexibacter stalactiti]